MIAPTFSEENMVSRQSDTFVCTTKVFFMPKEKSGSVLSAFEPEGQDLFFQGLEELIDLLAGGLPAEGDTEGSVDDLAGEVHGGQHMAAVALGTGGTGGNADTVLL